MGLIQRLRTARERRGETGSTLIEVMVYAALLSIIAALVASVMLAMTQAQQNVASSTLSANQSQTFLMQLRADLTNARSVTITNSGTKLTAQVPRQTGTFCWETINWTFTGDELLRNGNPLIDAGVSDGKFTVPQNNTIAIGDRNRTVGYGFTLAAHNTPEQDISGRLNIGPANQTGGATCK